MNEQQQQHKVGPICSHGTGGGGGNRETPLALPRAGARVQPFNNLHEQMANMDG
jgi:hypothetical protein